MLNFILAVAFLALLVSAAIAAAVEVTARPIRRPLTPAKARDAAQRVGWNRLIVRDQLRVVAGPVPDPGNPDHELVLAEHPEGALGNVRVLLARNATPEADGTFAAVAIPVPDDFTDPVEAAAWTYDDPTHPLATSPATYRDLTRRT